MNKLENDFNINLKRIIRTRKKNLKNILQGVNNPANKISSIGSNANKNSYLVKHSELDNLDYTEYKNELLDINFRKKKF